MEKQDWIKEGDTAQVSAQKYFTNIPYMEIWPDYNVRKKNESEKSDNSSLT